jgi:hypothetical protein
LSGWQARAFRGVRLDWLLRDGSAHRISPDPEGGITRIAMLGGSQAMSAELEVEVEVVVDAGMSG